MQFGPLSVRSSVITLCIRSPIGQITHVRNHVKIYPWRFNRNRRECYLDPTRTPYTDKHNINEFMNFKRKKKPWQVVIPKDKDLRFRAYELNDTYRSDPAEAKNLAHTKLESLKDSLLARGLPRESKPYEPPVDVDKTVIDLYNKLTGANHTLSEVREVDIEQGMRFKLFTACIEMFKHDIPSPVLNDLKTVHDVVEYFSTPVRGINSYSAMVRQSDSLPVNLSLISDPIRYNKDSDNFFGGYTAYPGLVSKVPGLRASKSYPILNQDEFQWPDV